MKSFVFMKKDGLTLIELLVVATILMVLTGGSLAAYRSFNNRQVLDATVKELKNNLRLAHNWAVGVRKVSCGQDRTSGGYKVDFSGGHGDYGIIEMCADIEVGEWKNFSYPDGVTDNYDGSFIFKPLTGDLKDGDEVTVTLTYKGKTATVTIKSNGLIE